MNFIQKGTTSQQPRGGFVLGIEDSFDVGNIMGELLLGTMFIGKVLEA